MNCSAAPTASARSGPTTSCSGRGSSAAPSASACSRSAACAATHAGVRCRRRQRQAENQDSARKRASEAAFLWGIQLKEGVHGEDPSGWIVAQETRLR